MGLEREKDQGIREEQRLGVMDLEREGDWGLGIQRENGGQVFRYIDMLGLMYLEKVRDQEMGFQREREITHQVFKVRDKQK